MYYSYDITIPYYLCDRTDHLSMGALARLFQEAADGHTAHTGLGYNALLEIGKAWVLCRVMYEVKSLPHAGDEVTFRTWSRGTNGLFAIREYQMYPKGEPENILAAGSSYWSIIDFSTRHVVRIHDEMERFEMHDDVATRFESLNKLRVPKMEESDVVAQFPVRPSELDHTQHVNNAEYIKWIFDHQAEPNEATCSAPAPFVFEINYLMETRMGDSVQILRQESDGASYFQIRNTQSMAVTARIFK